MKIFLDLDGTLINPMRRCYSIYLDFINDMGYYAHDILTYWRMKRDGVSEEAVVSESMPRHLVKCYIEQRQGLLESMEYLSLDSVFKGVHSTLGKWATNHELYLVTLRRNRINLKLQLDQLGLYKYFKNVYSGSTNKTLLIRHEVVDPMNCVIVGDTEKDINTGKSLGIKTVAVLSGIRCKRLLEKTLPNAVVENIFDWRP